MKFVFIAKHRNVWPVAWLCDALGVSRSGFHAWLNRSPSARSAVTKLWANRSRQALSPVTEPMGRAVSGVICWQKVPNVDCIGSSV